MAASTIAEVRALHHQFSYRYFEQMTTCGYLVAHECDEDRQDWPCRTIRTLDAAGDDDGLAWTLMFELHQPVRRLLRGVRCTEDRQPWPCRTASLLGFDLT